MRVLLITDWPGEGGGVENYLLLLERALSAAGDEVRLLTSSVGAGPDEADYVAYSTRNPALQSVLQIANPAAARAVRRAVADFRPDVALGAMFEMHLSPSALSALGSVPLVLGIHYYKPICPNGLKLRADDSVCTVSQGLVCWRGGCFPAAHWLRDRPRYARIARAVHRASAVTACSQWMQRTLAAEGIVAEWAPMPVETPSASFVRAPARDPVVVCVGRLAREKGVDTLLRALPLARAESPSLRLRIVGDGPLRPALEGLARELGIAGAVEFTGWLPFQQVERAMADAWALAVPSRWAEPFGLTALEAVVRRVPVVASATGGLAETVEAGVSGALFPNGDVSALARCLSAVATGRLLPEGVPDEWARRKQRDHDVTGHVAWLRNLFRRVTA